MLDKVEGSCSPEVFDLVAVAFLDEDGVVTLEDSR